MARRQKYKVLLPEKERDRLKRFVKTGKAKAIRFSTLDALCKALDCQPGDILEFRDM